VSPSPLPPVCPSVQCPSFCRGTVYADRKARLYASASRESRAYRAPDRAAAVCTQVTTRYLLHLASVHLPSETVKRRAISGLARRLPGVLPAAEGTGRGWPKKRRCGWIFSWTNVERGRDSKGRFFCEGAESLVSLVIVYLSDPCPSKIIINSAARNYSIRCEAFLKRYVQV